MDLNARVDENCGQKDGLMVWRTDRRTENRTPISHFTKAGATTNRQTELLFFNLVEKFGRFFNFYMFQTAAF